jgi:UDP-galactopyranose mutase
MSDHFDFLIPGAGFAWPRRRRTIPIAAPDARALYQKYAARATQEKNVSFVGRLATHRCYDIDQIVGMALSGLKDCGNNIAAPKAEGND